MRTTDLTKLMKILTFGCEVEMTGITRKEAANIVAKELGEWGVVRRYTGGTYDAWEVTDLQDRIWKIMRDGSIETLDEKKKVELVTPILKYEDLNTLQRIIRALRLAGAKKNKSCGIHIHIGAEKFTATSLKNLANIFAAHEDLIYKALQVDGKHRNVDYCKKTDKWFLKDLNKKKINDLDDVARAWYMEDNNPYELEIRKHRHYDKSRYHGLNLHAFWQKGTVEFRVFNSTLQANRITAYIQFCLALAAQALTQKRATYKKQETDNEKYAFRCWMLRLGLIGEEFQNCRKIFLEHLDGCSAWRYGKPQQQAA